MTNTLYFNPLEKLNLDDPSQNSKYIVTKSIDSYYECLSYIRTLNPNYIDNNELTYERTSFADPNNPTENGKYYLTYNSSGIYIGRHFIKEIFQNLDQHDQNIIHL